jgi:WD40 repeat protein
VQVPTAFGTQLAKVAKGRVLSIKNLSFDQVELAVCDACVPPDAQAALGGPVLDQLAVAFDESSGEIVFTPKEGAKGVSVSSSKSLVLARSFEFPASVNDVSLDAKGEVAGVAFSETKSERTKAVYDREKKKEVEPEREWDCGARVELASGKVLEKKSGHHGVVASVGISPDGRILATGGWDKKVILHGVPEAIESDYGWAIRRVRFSRDGRRLVVAAWTPQNPLNNHQSDPAAVVYEVVYGDGVSVQSR